MAQKVVLDNKSLDEIDIEKWNQIDAFDISTIAKKFRFISIGADDAKGTQITIDSTGMGDNNIIAIIFTRYAISLLRSECTAQGELHNLSINQLIGSNPFYNSIIVNGDIHLSLRAWQDFNMFYFTHYNRTPKFIVTHNSPNEIRYIRVRLNGSSANPSSHFVEVQAIDDSGVNRALNKTVTVISTTGYEGTNFPVIVDGNTSTDSFGGFTGDTTLQIDLGSIYHINTIKRWNYYGDGRTYYNVVTSVSLDGNIWRTIYDSEVNGRYAETSAGKSMSL